MVTVENSVVVIVQHPVVVVAAVVAVEAGIPIYSGKTPEVDDLAFVVWVRFVALEDACSFEDSVVVVVVVAAAVVVVVG